MTVRALPVTVCMHPTVGCILPMTVCIHPIIENVFPIIVRMFPITVCVFPMTVCIYPIIGNVRPIIIRTFPMTVCMLSVTVCIHPTIGRILPMTIPAGGHKVRTETRRVQGGSHEIQVEDTKDGTVSRARTSGSESKSSSREAITAANRLIRAAS